MSQLWKKKKTTKKSLPRSHKSLWVSWTPWKWRKGRVLDWAATGPPWGNEKAVLIVSREQLSHFAAHTECMTCFSALIWQNLSRGATGRHRSTWECVCVCVWKRERTCLNEIICVCVCVCFTRYLPLWRHGGRESLGLPGWATREVKLELELADLVNHKTPKPKQLKKIF